MSDIKTVVQRQREYFASGETLDLDFRIQALNKLKEYIKKYTNLWLM